MAVIDVEALLREISPDAPCGKDISYDIAFLELEGLVQGMAQTPSGGHTHGGEKSDWRRVCTQSLALLESSRDLRLILYLTLCALNLEGFTGFRDGLALLLGMVEKYWEHVYPQLDPDDGNDPLERMNIIASLSPPLTVMSDQDALRFIPRLMDVPLCHPEDARLPQPSFRQIQIASGDISVPEEEADGLPNMQLIDAAFEHTEAAALQQNSEVLQDCLGHLGALDSILTERVGSAAAPDFGRLEQLLKQMHAKIGMYLERRGYGANASLLKQLQTKVGSYLEKKKTAAGKTTADADDPNTATQSMHQTGLSGQIRSKQEVLQALDMIVSYYEQNEPSSPVPLLIKRAKRLVGRSFMDIIRDLSPDAISQVKMVSGEQEETSGE